VDVVNRDGSWMRQQWKSLKSALADLVSRFYNRSGQSESDDIYKLFEGYCNGDNNLLYGFCFLNGSRNIPIQCGKKMDTGTMDSMDNEGRPVTAKAKRNRVIAPASGHGDISMERLYDIKEKQTIAGVAIEIVNSQNNVMAPVRAGAVQFLQNMMDYGNNLFSGADNHQTSRYARDRSSSTQARTRACASSSNVSTSSEAYIASGTIRGETSDSSESPNVPAIVNDTIEERPASRPSPLSSLITSGPGNLPPQKKGRYTSHARSIARGKKTLYDSDDDEV
jgi:hypothetical protein